MYAVYLHEQEHIGRMQKLLTALLLFISLAAMARERRALCPETGKDSALADIAKGDSCYAALHSFEAFQYYTVASASSASDSMLAWRFAKVYTAFALTSTSSKDEQWNYDHAKSYAERALQYDPNNEQAHIALAVYDGWRTYFETDNEAKVRDSRAMHDEILRALQLNPNDDFAYNLSGQWNREVAKLSWIKKAVVTMIYGGLPNASFEQSVDDLNHAIALQPNRIMHYVELGKTYLAMDEKDKARELFDKVLQMPSIDGVDDKLKNEVRQKLAANFAGE